MTTGFTATAFVKMLTRKRDALQSELNLLRAKQDVAAYLVQQQVAHLETANDLLVEAIKLQNAVIADVDFSINRDGSITVNRPIMEKPLQGTAKMEDL